ncbi:MAG TPA: alcohol dehydrogenase catalytic domain-containing protein [Gaiellales bacterium]|jgi:threonine dehydrogenase-like Zn-dependent dehydrogenase|nr:alcohol dehydrogenase catalytic domain-containing protein [Gaiellales bacterium]
MRAAVWNDKGTLDVIERPTPEPRPGWARLAVRSVGICGTDLHFYRGSFPSPTGLLPGHEVGGIVDLTGEGVTVAAGTPVAVDPLVTCGRCPQCLTGNYNRCPQRQLLGVTGRGGLAEYMTVPAAGLYPLPAEVPAEAGSLVEPLAVCVRGTRLADVGLGDRVLVLGAGTIGLLSIITARAAGAAEVHVTARHDRQGEMARALGADSVYASGEEAAGALGERQIDTVIETVGGKAATIAEAVRAVRPGGTIAMLGVFDGDTPLPGLDFSVKEVRLVGSNCYGRFGTHTDFSVAVELLRGRLPDVQALVTHRLPLERVNEAFATAADKATGSIKVALTP